MKRLVIAACFTAAAGAAFAGAWHAGYLEKITDNSHGGIAACEKNLIYKLQAPSTYKRISASFKERQPFTMPEYKEYIVTGYCGLDAAWHRCDLGNGIVQFRAMQIAASHGIKGRLNRHQALKYRRVVWEEFFANYSKTARQYPPAEVKIVYDADNAFGTPIRDTELCRFGSRSPDGYIRSYLYGDPDADPRDWLDN